MRARSELITILREGVQFELIEPFRFYFDESYIEIPKGFKTDFGSIPLIFQGIISPVGKPTKAYVLHDFLCEQAHQGLIPRVQADKKFKEALEIQKIGFIKRNVIYLSVRLYALFKGLK